MNKLALATALVSCPLVPAFEPLSEKPWSHFGPLCNFYAKGRQGYPDAGFTMLKAFIDSKAPVLDLGCGTGISTRQLFEQNIKNVIGCDRDALMLQAAQANNFQEITYIQGDVTKGLPFANEQFELVTTFSAFQWFTDCFSVNEIARIIKPMGYFLAARKGSGMAEYRKVADRLAEEMLGQPLPLKETYEPEKSLMGQGFGIVYSATIPYVEYYTKQQVLDYLQSRSRWNAVKGSFQEDEILTRISAYLDSALTPEGTIKAEGHATFVLSQKLK
jgi:ubiquinone/menaquinone biosynthesis C-methylase UbiE